MAEALRAVNLPSAPQRGQAGQATVHGRGAWQDVAEAVVGGDGSGGFDGPVVVECGGRGFLGGR
jgi:hypothetical protein